MSSRPAKKQKPHAIVLSGYGLNCEEETKFAFDAAGAAADIVHVNDLIDGRVKLSRYQILAVPGGFSYGDDTGSGKAYANRMKNHLGDAVRKFIARDTLMIGICNGFQVLTNLGVLPGALTFNDSARYTDRWVDLKVEGESPWLSGMKTISLPIAHGEGKYYADKKTLAKLNKEHAVGARYYKGEISKRESLSANPNGAIEDIAAVLAEKGRIMGIMPHPERAMFFTQLPHWTSLREDYRRNHKEMPEWGPGIEIFRNAVRYFVSP